MKNACVHAHSLCVSDSSVTPWTVAPQAPLFIGFSRQEHWSGLSFPPPEDLPDPWIEPESLASPALTGRFLTTAQPGKCVYLPIKGV